MQTANTLNVLKHSREFGEINFVFNKSMNFDFLLHFVAVFAAQYLTGRTSIW